ncbi:exosortase A [Burkholderiaceae bacterium UC74_6]
MNPKLPPSWRLPLLTLLIVELAILLLYRRTGLAMVEIWDRSGTFAHAWVVPPISLWLIWRKRTELLARMPRFVPWLLLPMALLSVAWMLGDLVAVNAVTQLSFTALLVLAVPLCLGWSAVNVIVFPLLFLFFAVPIGEFMLPTMMDWTADFTVMALQLSGVPVYREGLSFVIPSGYWSVVEACSGVRYLIASTMVGTLFAYLNYNSLKKRLIFVGISILLPVLANWFRAYMIVMLGHLSNNTIATGVDHLIYGWVFFGIVMLALFLIGMRWADPEARHDATAAPALQAPVGSAARPIALAAVALLMLAVPVMAIERITAREAGGHVTLKAPEVEAQGWQRTAQIFPAYQPRFESPRAEFQALYDKSGGSVVGVYVAYYRDQDYQSKLISSNNVLAAADGKEWRMNSQGEVKVQAGTESLALRTAELRDLNLQGASQQTKRLQAWEIYWVDGRWTHSEVRAKLYGAWARLMGRGDDGAVLVIYGDRGEGAANAMTAFLRENLVLFERWLSAAKAAADAGARSQ